MTPRPDTLAHHSITDRCVCGAEFHAEGLPSWVGSQHERWLEAHAGCQFNAAVAKGLRRE